MAAGSVDIASKSPADRCSQTALLQKFLEPGYRFRMTFTDENGGVVEELTINSTDTIRQDPFFFTTEEGGLCFDYIWDLMDAEHDFIGDF